MLLLCSIGERLLGLAPHARSGRRPSACAASRALLLFLAEMVGANTRSTHASAAPAAPVGASRRESVGCGVVAEVGQREVNVAMAGRLDELRGDQPESVLASEVSRSGRHCEAADISRLRPPALAVYFYRSRPGPAIPGFGNAADTAVRSATAPDDLAEEERQQRRAAQTESQQHIKIGGRSPQLRLSMGNAGPRGPALYETSPRLVRARWPSEHGRTNTRRGGILAPLRAHQRSEFQFLLSNAAAFAEVTPASRCCSAGRPRASRGASPR